MEEEKTGDVEKPEEIIDEIVSRLDNMHSTLVRATSDVGYARDAFRAVRPSWEKLGNASTDDPDALYIYSSGFEQLKAIRDEVRAREDSIVPLSSLSTISGSAATFINTTGTTAAFVDVSIIDPLQHLPVFPSSGQHEIYAKRFSQFDPSLGKVYQEMWEILYGTRAGPERAVLYLMRQAYDHFFCNLAPDEEVRKSPYWTEKADGPNQIWRMERIRYAAGKHIKDRARANTLLASARHMCDVYQALNGAHTRGDLDQVKARQALSEMRTFLEDWANAVGI